MEETMSVSGLSLRGSWAVGCVLGALLVVGCPSEEYEGVSEVWSDQPRDMEPSVPPADLSALVEGNTAFSFDLLQTLSQGGGDLFFSPLSISQALAMTYAGARGETEIQMAETLQFTLPQERLHLAWNKLDLDLATRGQNAEEPCRLHLANAVWAQVGFEFEQAFLDTLAIHYGAGIYLADFSQSESARAAINNWVSQETQGRIEGLIPAGILSGDTRMVLTNAIYFKAAWLHKFREESTMDGPFYLEGGGTVTVPMMLQMQQFGYAYRNGVQALELPYQGGDLSMVVLLPDPGLFEETSTTLVGSTVRSLVSDLRYQSVYVQLPRFTYTSAFNLKKTLESLGMVAPFMEFGADFSGMNTEVPLYILEVIHQAFVDVNEAGTEAAAATSVVVNQADASVSPPEPIEFIVDRPFIFLIRDTITGTILFLGRVENPLE
jgi:serpin B